MPPSTKITTNKTILTMLFLFAINIAIFSYHSFVYFSFSPPHQIIMGDDYKVIRIVTNYFESYLALAIAIISILVLLVYSKYKVIPYLIWIILVGSYSILLMIDIIIINRGFILIYSLPIMLYPIYQVIRPIIIRSTS